MNIEENKFLELINEIPNVAVQGYDKSRKVIYWNKASEHVYGYSYEEAIGKQLEDLIIPDFMRDDVITHIKNWHENNIPIPSSELPLKHKDGSTVHVYSSHVMLKEYSSEPEMFCVDINLTEQKKLEEIINKKNEEFKKVFEIYDFAVKGSQDGLWDWQIESNEVFLSDRWKSMLGYKENELEDSFDTWFNLIHPDDKELAMNHVTDALSGDVPSFEYRLRLQHKDSSWIWVLNRGTTYFKEDKPVRMSGFHTDITEMLKKDKMLNEKENMLLHQSKMASMGEMIANISHQWRQPLSVISTQATGAKLELEMGLMTNSKLTCIFDSIYETIQHLSSTMDDFKNFYVPNKMNKVETNISTTIEKSLKLVSSQLRTNNIEVQKNIEELFIHTFEGELVQVLINLFSNAKDALINIDNKRVLIIKVYKKDSFVYIEVLDNAKGIDEEILEKIFEPYFTTKESSQGTGLGLYMSKEIVVKHLKGELLVENKSFEIDNESYRGANFIIKLPL